MSTQSRPNNALRAVRLSMRLSQDEFAERMRQAGAESTTKRTVQRYESGEIAQPRPASARALEVVTRLPIQSLGFPADVDAMVVDDGRGGHDLEVRGTTLPTQAGPARSNGGYSGVWLSRYQYFSSGRNDTYTGQHHVVLLQHGDRVTVRSLHGGNKSLLTMDLVVDGNVITGTWVEETDPTGYYRGGRYHGAIQLLAEPTGRRLTGKWVGFGKEMDINTGPWELSFLDASTSKATLTKYAEEPENE
ncbi:XRE family transcriptional regulator [Actinoplanes sp. NEAU-A12]|uniref:XRE family transcriptional regulator n=1 Tax=Actinoplanes sandaracinus TaxID=3045177 RepID=A0ABT6WEC4_9ACTN|nr:XRE family transcriptional regulator [Actinoplanes sandaracinus]MDI6098071.1 XRE family transcriptional regulator [Actinoplanes sandaracinus]